MISNKPYLVRAFHHWILDNAWTPILVANADHPQCQVPQEYIENGEIVLNISPAAVRDFKIANDFARFSTSFSGVIHFVVVPVRAIIALYADENGQGIFFDNESDGRDFSIVEHNSMDVEYRPSEQMNHHEHPETTQSVSGDDGQMIPEKRKKPHLRLVE